MKTPSEQLTDLKRRFARATLRSALSVQDSPQRTELLTHALPLILGPRPEWSAAQAQALDAAIAISLTAEGRSAARAAINRAHGRTATYGSAPDGGGLLAYLPSGEMLRGHFVARRFVPSPSS